MSDPDPRALGQWLADRLVELLGTDEYHALCEELGL